MVDCLDIPCLLEKNTPAGTSRASPGPNGYIKDSSACRVCFLKLRLEEIGSDPCYRRAFGCLADGNVGGRYKNGPRGSRRLIYLLLIISIVNYCCSFRTQIIVTIKTL